MDIAAIIASRSLVCHFQPVVNVKTRRTVCVEALIRGVEPVGGLLIAPDELFRAADAAGLTLELDRVARETALSSFRRADLAESPILLINLNASILTASSLGSNRFVNAVREAGIEPGKVAIEVVESRVDNPEHLVSFTRRHRDLGFVIVIDDFGAKHSNLLRLNDVRPDIIKIDRGIVAGSERDGYKRSIIASICDLAHRNGALCVAEGIETEEELTTCYLLRADLFQGYYFARPTADVNAALNEAARRISDAWPVLEAAVVEELEATRSAQSRFRTLVAELGGSILSSGTAPQGAQEAIERFLHGHREAACAYLLDRDGLQVTDTVWRDGQPARRAVQLFQPAPRGFDHSLKHYFVNLRTKDEFFSDPYLSLATGNSCRTLSVRLRYPGGGESILCMDFEEE